MAREPQWTASIAVSSGRDNWIASFKGVMYKVCGFRNIIMASAATFVVMLGLLVVCQSAEQPALGPLILGGDGRVQVQGRGPTNRVFTLQTSSNLVDWRSIAVLDQRTRDPGSQEVFATNGCFMFLDPAVPPADKRFYRFAVSNVTSASDWKNQALLPNDVFASIPGSEGTGPGVRWLKFAIMLDDPTRVYYQDSQRYLLHYDFATTRLDPFAGMTRSAFDQVSLFSQNQRVLLGTVLIGPDDRAGEYAIQFSGRDPWPSRTVERFFRIVSSTVLAPAGSTAFYFPAYEQAQGAALDEAYFAANGIRVSSIDRWVRGNQVYAPGWALGRIRFVRGVEIAAAYLDGRLAPGDILFTDSVPSEVPFVAGIISLAPATPNSHAAILAGSYGVPFACLMDPDAQARAAQLDGKEVVLQAAEKDRFALVQLIDVDGSLDPALKSELMELNAPPAPKITPKSKYGRYFAETEALTPDDIQFFGGKAANFGLLRRVVPVHSPPAIAFSFDLWDAFMDQTLTGGMSLRSEISNRLSRHTYPPVMSSLAADLDAIRRLITRNAAFNAEQRSQIVVALAVFDPERNIRFRSSSNAEDAETFSAAGMYDSYSGCLPDDLDGDADGPSRCDRTETQERGVFRAIQKVYASFYNDNAFLERLRRGLDESQLAMGILVHHSTPDELELANGVATVSREASMDGQGEPQAVLVTQEGAVSVTNPEGNATPEVVHASPFGFELKQASTLVPIGSHVLDWPVEYELLRDLLFQVHEAYRGPSGIPISSQTPVLDFEYKKVHPGQLLLKQVRPLPRPQQDATPVFLLNEPTRYWVYQSEGSDIFANHRLKCFLTLENRNLQLNTTNLNQSFYSRADFDLRDGLQLLNEAGSLADWPDAVHQVTNDPQRGTVVLDAWAFGTGPVRRRFELTSILPAAANGPIIPQAEIRKWLTVNYTTPVTILDRNGARATTAIEEVQLIASPELSSLRPGHSERFAATNDLQFEVAFLTSTHASGPPLGIDKNFWGTYPAALSPWMHTRITGLIAEPLELAGYWSQSAKAGHKYRYAWYLFEPALEPNLSARQIEQLRAANIGMIHVEREVWTDGLVFVTIIGSDGIVRRWK